MGNEVTCFDSYSFYGDQLKSVKFSDSVQQIKSWSFAENTELTNVSFGSDLSLLDRDAFTGCLSIRNVGVP